jgi:hypothetical protein
MNNAVKIFDAAIKLCGEITDMACRGIYRPGQYTASVDIVRDTIVTLAQEGEFGLVAELSALSASLLDQGHMRIASSEHYLSHEDFLHHIQALPCAPSGLVNHVGINSEANALIVDSFLKSRALNNFQHINSIIGLMQALAKDSDITNWLKIATPMLAKDYNTAEVLKSFLYFNNELVKDNADRFQLLKVPLSNYRPSNNGVLDSLETALLDNLFTIGEKELVHHLASVSRKFFRPFKIHEYALRYQFSPTADYLRELERTSRPSSRAEDAGRHTSLFSYLLTDSSIETPLTKALTPQQLLEILAQDGATGPHGAITYDKRRVGLLLDETFKLSMGPRDKWDDVLKWYKDIPKNTLMLSSYYRGRQLSDQLGL